MAFGGFESYGEHFWVRDMWKDGRSAVVAYRFGSALNWQTCWDHDGAGNVGVDCNRSATEGTRVEWKLCLGEYAERDYFSCKGPWVDCA